MTIPLIIFVSSTFATFVGIMSGGGSSVITLPIFLSLGINLPLAVAIHKIAGFFCTPVSSYNYLKNRKIQWKFLLLFAFIGLIGAYFGVSFTIHLDQKILQPIIGALILILISYTYIKKDLGLKEKVVKSKFKRALAYPVALIMGFYEGIIGSGNGVIFSALTIKTRGFDFIDALGHYYAIAFFWVTFAAILYIQKGYFDLNMAIACALGSTLGSYMGSKYGRYKGNKFIKSAFIIIGAILGIKMIAGI
jgi:hypothetical protein